MAQEFSCPDCDNSELIIKKGRNGKFWGCRSYPKCKATFDDDNGKPLIPKESVRDVRLPLCKHQLFLSLEEQETFTDVKDSLPRLESLGKGQIKFLEKSLLDLCEFYGKDDLQSDLWLVFFAGTPQERIISVRPKKEIDIYEWKKQSIRAEGVFLTTIPYKEFKKEAEAVQNEYWARVFDEAKSCLDGCKAKPLTDGDFITDIHPSFATKRRGFVVLNTPQDQFFRILILYGLAMAYQDVYRQFSNNMTDAAQKRIRGAGSNFLKRWWVNRSSTKALMKLRRDVVAFSTGLVWHYPLLPQNADLIRIWQRLNSSWMLHQTHNEVKEQLGELEDMVSVMRDKRLQFVLWAIGTIGLINVFAEPQEVRSFVMAAVSYLV